MADTIRAIAEAIKAFFDGFGFFEFLLVLVVLVFAFVFVDAVFVPDQSLTGEAIRALVDGIAPLLDRQS